MVPPCKLVAFILLFRGLPFRCGRRRSPPFGETLFPAHCIESTKGTYCANSYNAWGWSARGGGWRSFGSWSEGISAHVAYLGANYGSTLTPAAAKKYCPPTWQDWYNKVAAQMNRI